MGFVAVFVVVFLGGGGVVCGFLLFFLINCYVSRMAGNQRLNVGEN